MNTRVLSLVIRMTSMAASAIALVWTITGPKVVVNLSPRRFVFKSTGTIPLLKARDTTPDALLERAVERDPFTSVDRAGTESPAPAPQTVANEPSLQVLGTVVDSSGGSFALCQLGATPAVVLRVGQRIGHYELRRIEKGRVQFATPDGESVELRVPRAGA